MCEVLGIPSSAERVEQGRKRRKEEKRKEEKRRGQRKGKKENDEKTKIEKFKIENSSFQTLYSLGGDFIFVVGQRSLLHPCMKHNF